MTATGGHIKFKVHWDGGETNLAAIRLAVSGPSMSDIFVPLGLVLIHRRKQQFGDRVMHALPTVIIHGVFNSLGWFFYPLSYLKQRVTAWDRIGGSYM